MLFFAKFNSNVKKLFTRELSYVFNPRDEQNAQLVCHFSCLFMSIIFVLVVGLLITPLLISIFAICNASIIFNERDFVFSHGEKNCNTC